MRKNDRIVDHHGVVHRVAEGSAWPKGAYLWEQTYGARFVCGFIYQSSWRPRGTRLLPVSCLWCLSGKVL